jgi:hypothetical protein
MLPHRALAALALALLPAACAAGPTPRSATRAADANASPEAVANARQAYAGVFAAVQRAAVACEQGAATVNADLAAALDEVQHGSPHAESPGRLLARLRAERVAFTIVFPANQWSPEVRDGIQTRRQQWLGTPHDGKEQAELDELRRTEQSVGWVADELRAQVTLFGKAFADAHLDRVTCDQAAQQAAAHLLNYDRPELRDGLRPELAQARELLRRVARASHANGAAEAAATGIFAAYEAAAAHDHPEVLDHALESLRASLAQPGAISETDVDEAANRAVHEEAGRLVRTAGDRAGDTNAALYLVTVTRDAEADLTGPRGGVAAPQGGSRVRPVDLRPLGDAMRSVTQGDYRSAMKNAAPYVPGPLGGLFAKARGSVEESISSAR